MNLTEANIIAEAIVAKLSPKCEKCEIAGSIRRKKHNVKSIDLVIIPKSFNITFLEKIEERITKMLGQWPCPGNELRIGAARLQYQLAEELKLNIFFACRDNWGIVLALHTGSISFVKQFRAHCKILGYKWENDFLISDKKIIQIPDEHTLFETLKIPHSPPSIDKKRKQIIPTTQGEKKDKRQTLDKGITHV